MRSSPKMLRCLPHAFVAVPFCRTFVRKPVLHFATQSVAARQKIHKAFSLSVPVVIVPLHLIAPRPFQEKRSLRL